ncbi:MAG: HlyD family efflux transporter periplasmic adaptor subunit [Nitrosomonas sp.]|nr:MAG: HlyD family efflux transporter periplasmic adaptor subunit [Nitrosomonas sp.]
MPDKPHSEDNKTSSVLLQLEADARHAEDLLALQYFIVNETRRLLRYRHAILFQAGGEKDHSFQAIRVSGVASIDRSTPKIHYIERIVDGLKTHPAAEQPVRVVFEQLPDELQQDRHHLSLPFPVWVGLRLPDGLLIGALWLERESAWSDDELFLIKRLADTYAHAWGYFDKHRQFRSWLLSRKTLWTAGILLSTLFLLPIQHSTLGPVSVIAKDPWVVSAPIDGVIASIPAEPNQTVSPGLTLFRYEDTNYRNEYAVAEQTLAVTEAELKKATQSAFQDEKSKAEVALLKARVNLAMIKRDYAKEMLDHVHVVAEKTGVLLFGDKSEMIGRPVAVGEKLMEIAEIGKFMFRIDLPVESNIHFAPGAPVRIYLDIDPLHSIDAQVTRIGFRAEIAPGDILVYRIEAEPTAAVDHLRIGWQGTAKIYGDSVSLFFYLFRRPLAAARQYLGY